MRVEIIGHDAHLTSDESLQMTSRRIRPFGDGSPVWPYHGHRARPAGEDPMMGADLALRYASTRPMPLGGSPEFGGFFGNIARAVSRTAKSVVKATPVGFAYTAATQGFKPAIKNVLRATPIGIAHTAATRGVLAAAVQASPTLTFAKHAGLVTPKNVRTASQIAQNPMVRAGAAGAAFVFPPIGVPLVAAVEAANLIARNTKSLIPEKRRAAAKVVMRTAAAAKKGDKDARRGLKLLSVASRHMRQDKRNKRVAFVVTPDGRIYRDTSVAR